MRIKEQETRVTLHEHDDDDEFLTRHANVGSIRTILDLIQTALPYTKNASTQTVVFRAATQHSILPANKERKI